MKLMTKEVAKTIPALYSQEKVADPIVYAKFFDPTGRGTWLVTELDSDGDTCFGFVISPLGPDCDELGNFSIQELASVKGRLGLGIERDLYFTPKPLSEALEQYGIKR